MKKGALHFLGRKNQSLYDTKTEIKEIGNGKLLLDTSAIPESGTAKVRARPTVKHLSQHTSSSDAVQGFAVPTPKVPLLPPCNILKTNGKVNSETLSNRESMAVLDPLEGEIFIPPPPSSAPPPPPPQFIPPPPDFATDPESTILAYLQPPSMPPPKPPLKIPSQEPDLALAMVPPKPPSDQYSAKFSEPLFPSLPNGFPEPPKFAPPQLPIPVPVEPPQIVFPKAHKVPPPKPVRFSSIPSLDQQPSIPTQPPPTQVPAPSSFNPENTKLYSITKNTNLNGQADHETKSESILRNSSSDHVLNQVSGKAPSGLTDISTKSLVAPVKPARRNSSGIQLEKDLHDLKDNSQYTLTSKENKIQRDDAVNSTSLLTPNNPLNGPGAQAALANLEKAPSALGSLETSNIQLPVGSPGRNHKYIPYASHRLNENLGKRESSPSPMALLLAAKEREKNRYSLTRDSSSNEPSSASIHQSELKPNSFTVIPKFASTSSLIRQEISDIELPSSTRVNIQPYGTSHCPVLPEGKLVSSNPELSALHHFCATPSENSTTKLLDWSKMHTISRRPSSSLKNEENGEALCIPLLPPPPEFANSNEVEVSEEGESNQVSLERPPSLPPPDPPSQKISLPPVPPALIPSKAPAPPPKPKLKLGIPQSAHKVTPLNDQMLSKANLKPAPTPNLAGPPLSDRHATLLSILQKKMLEVDQKHSFPEINTSNDDWDTPVSDEQSGIPFPKKQSLSAQIQNQTPGKMQIQTRAQTETQAQMPTMDMSALGVQVAKRAQDFSTSTKFDTSNGPHSKQPCGMTFTVRPGSKQPITLVSKDNCS